MRLHHVQVSCPPGGEADARRFYADGLGLVEVPKPAALQSRGGAWFRAIDASGAVIAEVHIGVEEPFRPAKKAHPALMVEGPQQLERVAARLEAAGFNIEWRERHTFDGFERFHTTDAAGNRVEVMAPADR